MNNLFDALNRKFPLEGIKHDSKDLQVLKETLTWLNEWELNLKNNLITEDQFLTKQTADGLRMTIISTIDLVNYLHECGFSYVLTSKTNQDCLEKFFGVIRQVAGPNDHPSTPTFMQLYRILSMYTLIKPPKSGNCSVLEENVPVIHIADLKDIAKEQNDSLVRTEKILKLKSKMDEIIDNNNWDFDDIFKDHNYCNKNESTVFECIVYFLTGYIAKRLKKMIKCENYLKYLNNQYGTVLEPEGELVNIKTKGFLTHPNYSLYLLVKEFELSFMIHADSYDVFEKTYETVLENKNFKLKWQCLEHKSKILTDVYTMYITMRMRHHSYAKNQETKKMNKTKKKISKLVVS